MKVHASSALGAIGLTSCMVVYFYFVRVADTAMDKAGLSDLATWQLYQTRAGFAFWAAVILWCGLLVWAVLRKGAERSELLAVCGWAPVVTLGLALLSVLA
jgi:hypothetical protein